MKRVEPPACPFCGGRNLDYLAPVSRCNSGIKRYIVQIKCKQCGARGSVVKSAILDWRDHLTEDEISRLIDTATEAFARRYGDGIENFKLEE